MKKTVSAILLAAGSSSRMGQDENGCSVNKMLLRLCGRTPIELCVRAFSPYADEIVVVASGDTAAAAEEALSVSSVPAKAVMGGARRQDSVYAGITAASGDIVAIHDCARCLVDGRVIEAALKSAGERSSGVAAISVRDTLRKKADGDPVDRDGLVSMQTPQCFDRKMLIDAYAHADISATDDAAIWQAYYGKAELTQGSLMNQKLTESGDIEFFERAIKGGNSCMRIGIGEDTHRLTEGRRLVLGGVEIPFRLGLLGHSDADVLVHAVIDALLGAAALGDIGRHFPDNDPQYKDISSILLLKKTSELLINAGYRPVNIDATITAQEPKLAPYIEDMREKIAEAIPRIGIEDVSIKATTPERLGPEGSLQSITVRAVACIDRL